MDRNVIPLSPEMFRELDVMARKMAGVVLIVREWLEMNGAFGRREALYTSAIVDTTLPEQSWKGCDVSWIEIANEIAPSAFHSCKRPEMDWMAVKPPRYLPIHSPARDRTRPAELQRNRSDGEQGAGSREFQGDCRKIAHTERSPGRPIRMGETLSRRTAPPAGRPDIFRNQL